MNLLLWLNILLLLVGLVILVAGAEYMVRGSASMASKWGLPSIVIGLTIVAFGTSAPEMMVNLFSAAKGTTDLAIANVIGSNMANILLILGVGAMIRTLDVKKGTTYKEIPFALLAMVLVAIMANDGIIDGGLSNALTRSDGLAMLAFFGIFLYYTYSLSKTAGTSEKIKQYSWPLSTVMFIGGLTALIVGGKLIVDNAISLATLAGLSEGLIGLTIVALGTSLPELATTVVALRKGHTDLAIGNVIGSNIFNVFWILGLTATIAPLPFDTQANADVLFTTLITLLLFIVMFVGQKNKITKVEGTIFLLLYFGYIGYAIVR
ncbi:MAG: sodium:proton exchanger [Candidatus Magasanikbacteria bacterium CG10_big_fil_rev_8_21_14_0_10_47_10]|uniref:Sodium:proton exchanger n=1 Tax=Candidatus Magasanikbacteria bacterium CG10_big_fil_rev_8_21_14_0_10_47_10 TaxID=1974652 RepID=A0A2H0TSY7_9BACT|nr:MAG: sodium:proton exchanger [Candidatus Magasanikbacteria bacterium CG10_big_fil_rev_8_21_14_0_10_47_10]